MTTGTEDARTRNARVQSRYDELMAEGRHGHYETMFRVVREEVERALSSSGDQRDDAIEAVANNMPKIGRRYISNQGRGPYTATVISTDGARTVLAYRKSVDGGEEYTTLPTRLFATDTCGWVAVADTAVDASLLDELLLAAKRVLANLNQRIDAAPDTAKPVFDGIADLHDAIGRSEIALKSVPADKEKA